MTNPQGEVVNVTFSTFMNIFPNTKESPEEYIYEALSQINNLKENENTERLQEN